MTTFLAAASAISLQFYCIVVLDVGTSLQATSFLTPYDPFDFSITKCTKNTQKHSVQFRIIYSKVKCGSISKVGKVRKEVGYKNAYHFKLII